MEELGVVVNISKMNQFATGPRYLAPPVENRLLLCAKRYGWLAQQAPENHKYGFFIEPEIKKFHVSRNEFLEGLNFSKRVTYWKRATLTFKANGLQHSFVVAPSYAERGVDL